MDRNTIIGIVLIVVVLIGFSIMSQPSAEEEAAMKRQQDSIALVIKDSLDQVAKKELKTENKPVIIAADSLKSDSLITDTIAADSIRLKRNVSMWGDFAMAAEGTNKFYSLENNKIKVVFSTQGGRVYSVQLKEYTTYDSLPLILFDGDSTEFGLTFYSSNRNINTNSLYFVPEAPDTAQVAESSTRTLIMKLPAGNDRYLSYTYSLEPNSYQLKMNVNTSKMAGVMDENAEYMQLNWGIFVPRQEKGIDFEKNNTTVYYKYFEEDVDYLSEMSDDNLELRTRVQWVAFKQQFFSSVLVAESPFAGANMTTEVYIGSNDYLKKLRSEFSLSAGMKEKEGQAFKFYFGPNHFQTLQDQEIEDLHKLVPLGWAIFGWINRYLVIPIFNFLDNYIGNYGIIILLLTIIIKLILFPLTYRSYKSSAKMKVLKPQIDEIHARIPKDKPMERQQATMALYKKVGVSPLGGCLPMLLQMPILFAMFRFFPASIELRQESFLWAEDLSTYDSIIDLPFNIPFYGDHVSLFCLLMTISTIMYTHMQNKMNPSTGMPGMKFMMYMFPIMFLFVFNSYSSGLSYYYLVANLITFGQMWAIRRFVDEEAILAKLNENKKKPEKRSRFQERMEKMAKDRGYKLPKK